LFDSGQSKVADTFSGAGIVMGDPLAFPFIEVGWDSFNSTTGARSGPRVRMRAANTSVTDDIFTGLTGPQISINGSNIGFHVGPSSYFAGVPLGTGSGNKVLGRNSEGMLRWYDPGSGGSSGVSSFNTRTGAVTLTDADIQDLGAISGLGILTGNGFRNSSSTTTVEAWYGSTASGGSLPSAANYPANTILVIL
jgi:hypothetical protein